MYSCFAEMNVYCLDRYYRLSISKSSNLIDYGANAVGGMKQFGMGQKRKSERKGTIEPSPAINGGVTTCNAVLIVPRAASVFYPAITGGAGFWPVLTAVSHTPCCPAAGTF